MKKRTTLAKQLTVKIVVITAVIFIVAMLFTITVAKNTASKLSKDVMQKETVAARSVIITN